MRSSSKRLVPLKIRVCISSPNNPSVFFYYLLTIHPTEFKAITKKKLKKDTMVKRCYRESQVHAFRIEISAIRWSVLRLWFTYFAEHCYERGFLTQYCMLAVARSRWDLDMLNFWTWEICAIFYCLLFCYFFTERLFFTCNCWL